jgi:RTX calcium-binding nonapeptide repeat (4 copies)
MHGSMLGRAATVFVATMLLLIASIGPATGHEPAALRSLNPSHFNGDGTGGNHGPDSSGEANEAQILGDRFDGRNDTAVVRGIASADARFFEWYVCANENQNPYPGQCGGPVARDDTPFLSHTPAGVGQVASFSAPFDIQADGSMVVAAVACIEGPPARPGHCRLNRIAPVHLDNAATAEHEATDSGEITQPEHGSAVANAGFTVVAYTSQTDVGRAYFCLDVGTSPTTSENASPQPGCDPGSTADPTPDDGAPCSGVPVGADCWTATIDPPDESEFSLGVVEQDEFGANVSSGAGDCEGDTFIGNDGNDTGDDCQLDKIYLTSLANPPTGSANPQPGVGACPGFQDDPRNQVVGSPGNDELVGTQGKDILCGRGGKDTIRGKGGKDLLLGQGGKDNLLGGPKGDQLKGGPKNDRLNGGPGRDRCQGGPGRDREVSC